MSLYCCPFSHAHVLTFKTSSFNALLSSASCSLPLGSDILAPTPLPCQVQWLPRCQVHWTVFFPAIAVSCCSNCPLLFQTPALFLVSSCLFLQLWVATCPISLVLFWLLHLFSSILELLCSGDLMSLLIFLAALLRYKWCAINWTHLKCSTWCFDICIYPWNYHHSRVNLSITPKDLSWPLRSLSPLSPLTATHFIPKQ